MTNFMIPPAGARRALKTLVSKSQLDFAKHRINGTISGNWDDENWRYNGKNVNFSKIQIPQTRKEPISIISGDIINDTPGDILRSFVIEQIESGKSSELISGYLISAKILHYILGNEISRWHLATKVDYDKAYTLIKECYQAQTSIYHRANSLSYFIKYLSSIHTTATTPTHYFLSIRAGWNHNTPNPERAREQDRLKNIHARGDKYPEELEQCFGKLRSILKNSPHLERKSNTDSLLIEVMTFFLSMGLRFKEAATLPHNCYVDKEKYDTSRLRVLTHKGSTPSARPIPEVWDQLVKSAVAHISANCEAARKRALDIERNGFKFVSDIAAGKRALSTAQKQNIKESDLFALADDLCNYEIINDLNIGKKQTHKGGRYHKHLVRPRSTRAIQLSIFLKKAIATLQESIYPLSILKLVSQKSGLVSPQKIGMAAGIPKGSTINEPKMKETLKNIAQTLQNVLDTEKSLKGLSQDLRNVTVKTLEAMLHKLRSWPSSGTSSLINYKSLILQLEEDYSALLQKHFDENCTPDKLRSGSFKYSISTPSFTYEHPLSAHMIVLWEDQMNQRTNVSGCLPRPIYQADIYGWMSTKAYSESVFTRLDIRKKNGEIFSLSTHQVRHWLTTALLRSGPTEALVNLWMGRRSGQLRTYDHRTPKERAEFIRSIKIYEGPLPPSDWLGRKIKELRSSKFSQEEIHNFIETKLAILHFTPWGYCSRDLTLMPCDRGLMCIKGFGTQSTCENFHIDPTDLIARKKIEETRDNYYSAMLALEPKYHELKEQFISHLDDSSPLDQHLLHIIKIIKGCNVALEMYATLENERNKTTGEP